VQSVIAQIYVRQFLASKTFVPVAEWMLAAGAGLSGKPWTVSMADNAACEIHDYTLILFIVVAL
jgi:hypothetical protein